MKKIAYLIAFLALGFTCTSCDEPPVEEIKYVNVSVLTGDTDTSVGIITYADSNWHVIGQSEAPGVFKIPQNGFIEISWYRSGYWGTKYEKRINVGTTSSMIIQLYANGSITFD